MQEFKRRNYVVNRRLQFGMIAVFLTAVLVASIVVLVVMMIAAGAAGNMNAEQFIDTFLVPVLLNDLGIMAALVLVGIVFSNRIAGPLFHIQAVLEDVNAGETARRVHLRPKDYCQNLAENINMLLDSIEK